MLNKAMNIKHLFSCTQTSLGMVKFRITRGFKIQVISYLRSMKYLRLFTEKVYTKMMVLQIITLHSCMACWFTLLTCLSMNL